MAAAPAVTRRSHHWPDRVVDVQELLVRDLHRRALIFVCKSYVLPKDVPSATPKLCTEAAPPPPLPPFQWHVGTMSDWVSISRKKALSVTFYTAAVRSGTRSLIVLFLRPKPCSMHCTVGK